MGVARERCACVDPLFGERVAVSFLPIVERELRVGSRRRGTYWIRLGAALAAIALGSWIMILLFARSTQSLGSTLFYALSILAYLYCLVVGLVTTADCLSHEKREGTLGLLFLTDLKGYDIVLGKLTASSLNALYGLLAIFPVLAIPLMIGGVTFGEFGRVVLASANILFFSLAVGMLCSAWCRDERQSLTMTVGFLLVFTLGLPVVGSWLQSRYPARTELAYFVFVCSPGCASYMAYDAALRTLKGIQYYYGSLLCTHGLAWGFLGVACLKVPRSWQDRPGEARRLSWWRSLRLKSTARRRSARRRLLEINPCYWLGGRERGSITTVWVFLGVTALVWAWGLWKHPQDWHDESVFVLTALGLHFVLKSAMAFEAAQKLLVDRQSGALELLLCTPLAIREIVHGHFLALARNFAWPVLLVLGMDAAFFLSKLHDREWMGLFLAGGSIFLADMITLGFLGLWLGLTSRTTGRAAFSSLARILALPWLGFGMLMAAGAALFSNSYRGFSFPDWFPLASWFALSLLVDVIFCAWAYGQLIERLRINAQEKGAGGRGLVGGGRSFKASPAGAPDPSL